MTRRPRLIRQYLISPVLEFIRDSRAVGIVLLACTVISLSLSNLLPESGYMDFWLQELHFFPESLPMPHSPAHLINDLLMAVFFLMVGLEIKRELMTGELSDLKTAALPVFGAAGGMAIPALFYVVFNLGGAFMHGWAIPMATDIAFSLGILSLLGNKRATLSMRIFLMALAIIDDLGGIIAIAVFYTDNMAMNYLLYSGIIFLSLLALNLFRFRWLPVYFLLGVLLWYFVFRSGVHASIAGVLLAFTIPLSKSNKLIHALHDPVSFIILPLFALANTAFLIPGMDAIVADKTIVLGVGLGLILGKPIGIALFTIIGLKLLRMKRQEWMSLYNLVGLGLIAGIGFTISIFITALAFGGDQQAENASKLSILVASVLAGLMGYLVLHRKLKHEPEVAEPKAAH